MTKWEIVERIAKEKWVEDIIANLKSAKEEDTDNLKDLGQDTYIDLLSKDASLIEEMYNNGQLRFYITRMLINQIQSKNSPYYYMYKKNKLKCDRIKDDQATEED